MSETIALLKPDRKNRRKHNERNIGMIVNSLQQVGASRSIVIDEDNNILAGNGTVEAAQLAGIERMKVIDADGEEIIAVRRTGLTVEQKRKLALYDNRTAEIAEWDIEQLLEDVNAGLDFDGMFGKVELSELLGIVPDFQPVSVDEQGGLDQKKPVICPECGHEFIPK
jgi:ParB family transcriptional regulator, chromosome partitioning protein